LWFSFYMKIQELVSYCIFYTDYHPIIKYFHTDKQFDYFFNLSWLYKIATHTIHFSELFLWICVSKFMCAKSLYKTVCSIVVYGINFIIYVYNRIHRHRLLMTDGCWQNLFCYPMYVLFESFYIIFNSNWDSIRDERLYIQYVFHFEMAD